MSFNILEISSLDMAVVCDTVGFLETGETYPLSKGELLGTATLGLSVTKKRITCF